MKKITFHTVKQLSYYRNQKFSVN